MVSHDRGITASHPSGYFPTTHWSVVMNAGLPNGGNAASDALEQLCQTYWYPLYAYVRRRGFSEPDAQDHVQSFLGQLLERKTLQNVSQTKGRFRSFLLASLNYYLSDQFDRANALKRGGGPALTSFDGIEAEQRYKLEPLDKKSPDKLFERRWALTILDDVLRQLENEFRSQGSHDLFKKLQPYLVRNGGPETYSTLAKALNTTEEAVKKRMQRMRRRYHEIFCEQIARTLEHPEDLDDEIHYLFRIIAED